VCVSECVILYLRRQQVQTMFNCLENVFLAVASLC